MATTGARHKLITEALPLASAEAARLVCDAAALYPLDTIKTRLQTATSGGGLKALIQSGGGKALYSGILGNLAGVVPASAIFMGVYEPVKQARPLMLSSSHGAAMAE